MTLVEDRFDIMLKAVENAGYSGLMRIALDPASSEFFMMAHIKLVKNLFLEESWLIFMLIFVKNIQL